jgi:hypothetical protein
MDERTRDDLGRFGFEHGEGGQDQTVEYTSWCHMHARCYQPNNRKFKNYGERGIIVCDRWHKYENFLEDMGRKPDAKYTLGRVDNDGNYEPGNCRWETAKQQARNRRSTKLTMVDAREIRMLYRRGWRQWDIAHEFEVSQALISEIVRNTIWSEIEETEK